MKTITVYGLRYRFAEVEARLRDGSEIQVTKRKRVIARLVPVKPKRRRRRALDFMAMLTEIYGNKVAKVAGADLVCGQRRPY
jgi:antitoxin (DNA-binding transcriptional repressor) of toxin-antitoxin stability system